MFGVCSVPSSVLPSNYPQVAQLPALLKTIGFKRGGTEFSKAHSFALLNMQLPCLKPLVLGEALPKLCFIFRTACPHWGVLTVRCWIEVVASVCGQSPVNFTTKWLLWHVHKHFDRAGSHKTGVAADTPRISPVNFGTKWLLWCVHVHVDCPGSHKTMAAGDASDISLFLHKMIKMALLTCPCPFRLRRLEQNDDRGRRVRHFPCKFPHNMVLILWHVHVHFECAGSPVHTGSCGLSLCLETSSRELARRSCQETCYLDLVRRSCQETSYRKSCQQNSYRSCTEIWAGDH